MCKNTLFDRWINYYTMGPTQLLELLFSWNKCALYRYKTCAVSLSNTDKQQLIANQRFYRFSDKDSSMPDDIDLWHSAWTGLYIYKGAITLWNASYPK